MCWVCIDSDEVNRVMHSNDAFAPVAYLNLCKMHLEEKAVDDQVCIRFVQLESLSKCIVSLTFYPAHCCIYTHRYCSTQCSFIVGWSVVGWSPSRFVVVKELDSCPLSTVLYCCSLYYMSRKLFLIGNFGPKEHFGITRPLMNACTLFSWLLSVQILPSSMHRFRQICLVNFFWLACPSGTIGSIAVRVAWLQWPTSLGSRPRLAGSFVSGYSGICFEIKFSGRYREFDGCPLLNCDRWLILGLEALSH